MPSNFVIDDDDQHTERISLHDLDPFSDANVVPDRRSDDTSLFDTSSEDMGEPNTSGTNGAGRNEAGGVMARLRGRLGMAPAYRGVESARSAGGARNGGGGAGGADSAADLRQSRTSRIKGWWASMRGNQTYPAGSHRTIYINREEVNAAGAGEGPEPNGRFCDNSVSTAKYNAVTFLPKFFTEQFSKYANLFFLFTSAIQQVPTVSPTNRFTTIGTLAVVLAVSAVKEVHEDLKRRTSDNVQNDSAARVLVVRSAGAGDAPYARRRWADVRVGDVVRVEEGEPVPADMVVLSSSEPDGLCYVETSNLDGETNLKVKQAAPATAAVLNPRAVADMRGCITGEQPNSSLYTYEGTLAVAGREKCALTPDQVVLRGASVRNTRWIQGVVVFTGRETKVMRNATAAPIKRTQMERIINRQILALFGMLVVLSVASSLGDIITLAAQGTHLRYLRMEAANRAGVFFLDILTYWILYSNLVPISLFVTVEIIKYYQAYLISSDLDLYYEETDTPAVARTSSLVDELGQIQFVFSDKTGTLTQNVMKFRACSVAGRCYAQVIPEGQRARMVGGEEVGYHSFDELQSVAQGAAEDAEQDATEQRAAQPSAPEQNSSADPFADSSATAAACAACADAFLTLLATCHTVIPESLPDGSIHYQASSLDEGALVDGAAELGYTFKVRKPDSVAISVEGQRDRAYKLLNVCEFNSTRKRMSCVLRCPDGRIRLYVKGADTMIFERLADDSPYVAETTRHLEQFAGAGLRTLCLAQRVIPEDEYARWAETYRRADLSLDDRAQKLDAAAELIERDLQLLGATAIEDKLQDGVPDTIAALQEAGIRVWVLTGDRQETAINVGMSCRLLSEDMNLLIVNEETREATRTNLAEKRRALAELLRADPAHAAHPESDLQDYESDLALVIDGKSLDYALEPELEDDFLALALRCKAVICCRVSPLQKALVVKLVKRKRKDALLLAIGDGANDVSMIQAAHVGVGLSGREGMQAARAADFSIAQFRFLRKLLLVHGAWSYQRLSLAILYSFYKNITLYMCQFWYTFTNGFSGQSIIESWTLTMYNVIFLALPPFAIGIFDQFISPAMLLRYPRLYKLGQSGHFFNTRTFWAWIANGFYHSAIIFICVVAIYRYGSALSGGTIADLWCVGVTLYTVCLVTSLGKAALITAQSTKFTLLAIPGSFGLWVVVFPLYAIIAPRVDVSQEYFGIIGKVYGSATYWLCVIIIPVLCLLRDFLWKFYKRNWQPELYHEAQKIQRYQVNNHRPKFSSFQKTIRKVRQVHRMRKQHGYAFSQAAGQEAIIRKYDSTKTRGKYGELA